MSDRFHLIPMEQLTDWVFTELEEHDSILGVPRRSFFTPSTDDRFRTSKYGQVLETPFGVAAGPHSQMAQNIIVSWLVGARFIELKTIQTLDELDVNKPCIDLEDEGYNVEWSQELKVFESFDEYLRAWVLIHALHRELGFPGDTPGMIFNMSVGYDLAGIKQPNVQWYLDTMRDASDYLPAYIDLVARRSPGVRDIDIPATVSDTITLSTMHGCPPDEIEAIATYLMRERGLHTSVKCNPTLLGADRVRGIVNDELGYHDIVVPDEAFGHDLEYADAVPMFGRLRQVADETGLTFGLKLTNTLEVENHRTVFPDDETMYMSGRALHAVTSNLALQLADEYDGGLLLSFAGGADAFNSPDLLRSGLRSVTVCSDLLKTGGYLRMAQYLSELDDAIASTGADDLAGFTIRTAVADPGFSDFVELLGLDGADEIRRRLEAEPTLATVEAWADGDADVVDAVLAALGRINLRSHAAEARSNWRYVKSSFRTSHSKTPRSLHLFDCIEAPCVDECPIDQDVPAYMRAVAAGDMATAVQITRRDNPLGAILGRVCDHLCETTCIRTHLDQPLAIREMKRFIMEHEESPDAGATTPLEPRVAIIGAGPAGISAGRELGRAGIGATIFEMHGYAGGMVGGAIPEYRLPQEQIDADVDELTRLGIEIRYEQTAGEDFTLEELRAEGYDHVFVAVGAQLPKLLGVAGEDADGVLDALRFLRSVREGDPIEIGPRVGVVGAGDTAMDCVRSAWRVGATDTKLIYRRTIDQMPADREEVHAAIEENVEIMELVKPIGLRVEDGALRALVCSRTEYRGDRDASGRKIPHDVPDSEFEIELDTLILAISQHSLLDFFGDTIPEVTDRGYIDVDPSTFESSIERVYAGGDVAADGPSSIVKAAADGKAVAAVIIGRMGAEEPNGIESVRPPVDTHEMLARRAHREYRTPVRHTPVEERAGFAETIHTYTLEEAQTEASRCVDCDTFCSLCVGVCPNMALMTYQMEPYATDLATLSIDGGDVSVGPARRFAVDQTHQIAVLTDFCNECGNCETACPTSGVPYRDKPRLYLDRDDFEAEADNAFWVTADGIEGRFGGQTHRLAINGTVEYESDRLSAVLAAETLEVEDATPVEGAANGAVSLEPAATMYTVWRGLRSMPHIPRAGVEGALIAHPGYAE
jgi:putative selenate reductase